MIGQPKDHVEFIVDPDGTERWYLDGILGRKDGPAIRTAAGKTEFWYLRGLFHREDGPAVIFEDGEKAWYLHGCRYNCVEWMLKVHKLGLK